MGETTAQLEIISSKIKILVSFKMRNRLHILKSLSKRVWEITQALQAIANSIGSPPQHDS